MRRHPYSLYSSPTARLVLASDSPRSNLRFLCADDASVPYDVEPGDTRPPVAQPDYSRETPLTSVGVIEGCWADMSPKGALFQSARTAPPEVSPGAFHDCSHL
jgi:hypothetical protein